MKLSGFYFILYMKKIKFITYALLVIATLIFFGFIFRFNMSTENKYNLTARNNDNVFLTFGYYILKPVIEVYLDSRLESNNVFTGIKAQKFYDKVVGKMQIKPGNGKEIICGQKIKVNLSGNDVKNHAELVYVVGTSDLPLLNIAPIGMKKGELSAVAIPGYLANTMLKEEEITKTVGVTIEILDVLDDYPDEIKNMQIFTDETNNQTAKMCGDEVKLSYSVLDIAGNQIFSDKVNFKIGDRTAPIGLELASIGLQPGVARTVILNGNLINDGYNKDLKILKINKS